MSENSNHGQVANGESSMIVAEEILSFWFGELGPDATTEATAGKCQHELWWGKQAATDEEIGARFAAALAAAGAGELEHWREAARSELALIIILDQFSRTIHRGSARAFAYDDQALAACQEGVARGADRQLRHLERVFFYLPLEHAESLDCQNESVALYTDLLREAPAALGEVLRANLDFARRHRDVIEKFGRFPHRNELLGRSSSPEELGYLAQPDSGF